MRTQQPTDGAARRANVGQSTRKAELGGRWSAPGFGVWGPVAGRVMLAVGAAIVLAIIGARAGANPPPPLTSSPTAVEVAPAALVGEGRSADGGARSAIELPALAEGVGTLPDGRVVLNRAGEDDLTKLPGIGPSRAKAILALRARIGRFRTPHDLLRVKGIGRKTLLRMLPMVVVDSPRPGADAGPS